MAAASPASTPMPSIEELESRLPQIKATLYGQCVGDAIGILTEFMTKEECKENYPAKEIEYEQKLKDLHRIRWKTGDWTDDSDQMILILQSLVEHNGQFDLKDFSEKLKNWKLHGFRELGDYVGMGIGTLTDAVLSDKNYLNDPFATAKDHWQKSGSASNGGVMRTSVVGTHCWWSLPTVNKNALDFVMCSHYDPRCQASAVAVSVCISLMLQRQPQHMTKSGGYNVKRLIKDSFSWAHKCLKSYKDKWILWRYLSFKNIKSLKLDEKGKIGYTYKCLGAGFWALKQNNFREALQEVLMQGGDADTNSAVAGAMLGCKLGLEAIPTSWIDGLKFKEFLDRHVDMWLTFQREMGISQKPPAECTTVSSE